MILERCTWYDFGFTHSEKGVGDIHTHINSITDKGEVHKVAPPVKDMYRRTKHDKYTQRTQWAIQSRSGGQQVPNNPIVVSLIRA